MRQQNSRQQKISLGVFHFPSHPQEISLTNTDISVLILIDIIIDECEKRSVFHHLQTLKTN